MSASPPASKMLLVNEKGGRACIEDCEGIGKPQISPLRFGPDDNSVVNVHCSLNGPQGKSGAGDDKFRMMEAGP